MNFDCTLEYQTLTPYGGVKRLRHHIAYQEYSRVIGEAGEHIAQVANRDGVKKLRIRIKDDSRHNIFDETLCAKYNMRIVEITLNLLTLPTQNRQMCADIAKKLMEIEKCSSN